MRTVDRYVLRVLADRWVPSPGASTLQRAVLDLTVHADGLAAELAGRGFRVTTLTLGTASLAALAERLVGLPGSWDAIACRGVLSRVEDWPELLGRLAARLRPGGVLIYAVDRGGTSRLGRLADGMRQWVGLGGSASRQRRWLPAPDLVASLRRTGLVPRHLMAFGDRGAGSRATGYLGYSVKRMTAPAPTPAVRWNFTGTGERWLVPKPLAT